MRKREHVRRQVGELLAAAILAGMISTSSRADTPRTWGDIAGNRLDLQASVAVPLMTFRYGDGPDELPLRHDDDPMETVVAAFQVDERESVWILTVGAPSCDTLRHFVASSGEAVRDRIIPLPYCFSGFMVRPEGIYLSGFTGRGRTQFSLLTPDGALRRLSLVRGWGKESRWFSSVGRLRSFVIPTPAGQYGIGEGGSYSFTREHAYYLNLDRQAAALLRY
jgi:hypothetical protein